MQAKALSLLGLAARAGRVVSGEFSVETAIKKHKAYLVIIAKDASDNTRKHFEDMCRYRNIEIVSYSDRKSLGKCIGKDFRASVAVTDENFANGLKGEIRGGKLIENS